MSYLERYKQGEYVEVWNELYTIGDSLVTSSKRNDAIAVAEETMKRVKQNIETLYQKLLDLDYRFVKPNKAYIQAKENDYDKIEQLSEFVGGIPLSLKAWFKIVGQVDFRGSHPELAGYYPTDWEKDFNPHSNTKSYPYYSDPIFMPALDDVLMQAEEINDYRDSDDFDIENMEWMPLPDWFHKAGVSGSTYYFNLPEKAIDTRLIREPHDTTFVNYLRLAFQWGGFPGFHLHLDDQFEGWRSKWKMQKEYPDYPIPYDLLKELSKDLLDI